MSNLPDLLDNPTRLDDDRDVRKMADIFAEAGPTRRVAEDMSTTIEEKVEQVKFELEQLYPNSTFEVKYYEA